MYRGVCVGFLLAVIAAVVFAVAGCWSSGGASSGSAPDTDTDTDTDVDSDVDSDTDSDSDTDTETGIVDTDTDTDSDTDTDTDTEDTDTGEPPVDCGGEVVFGDVTLYDAADLEPLVGVTRIEGSLTVESAPLEDLVGLESLRCVDGDIRIVSGVMWSGDEWLDGLSGLVWIGGMLYVAENEDGAHVGFSRIGLESLERVEGGLGINNNGLVTLDGLSALAYVGGFGLEISDEGALTQIDALSNLAAIDGDLSLSGVDLLADVDGLSGLTEIGGNVDFRDCLALADLSGLSGVDEVYRLYILRCPSLASLYGLHNVELIADELYLNSDDALVNLEGLDALALVGGSFRIDGNASLESLDGPSSLVAAGSIEVIGNEALFDIDALDILTELAGDLYVHGNISLPTCEVVQYVQALQALGWDQEVTLYGNGPDPVGGCDGVDPWAGADVDTDADSDADADPQCAGLGDFASCDVDTTAEYGADLGYDICIDEHCVSPAACYTAACNTPGPHFAIPSDTAPGPYLRTMPVSSQPIVEDTVTGLVWQGCVAGMSASACTIGTPSYFNWVPAVLYCDTLNWGGNDDWYLPDAHELQSIAAYGSATGTALDTAAFPGDLLDKRNWSSTSHAGESTAGVYVDFADGAVRAGLKGTAMQIRCVRRAALALPERFARSLAEGVPVVSDAVTGLMWQGCVAGETGEHCTGYYTFGFDWEGAIDYCMTLSWGGASDWRLPTAKELLGIWDARVQIGVAIDPAAFPSSPTGSLWTSTEFGLSTDAAAIVNFYDADESWGLYYTDVDSEKGWAEFVRCVRDLP